MQTPYFLCGACRVYAYLYGTQVAFSTHFTVYNNILVDALKEKGVRWVIIVVIGDRPKTTQDNNNEHERKAKEYFPFFPISSGYYVVISPYKHPPAQHVAM